MSVTADDLRASSPGPGDGDGSLFEELVEELTDRLQAGDAVDVEAFLGRHPAHAERLRRLIPSLELMADLGQSSIEVDGIVPPATDPTAGLGELGDFRLVRELGRGGMGIVHEAEQISLRRRVALKVLPFAATLDARRIQRFQLEARAAACLHHPHIVPVHGVGCDRGVHYYAMQLIEGQSLAAMIAELRRLDGLDPADGPSAALDGVSTSDLAAHLLSGGSPDRPAGTGSDAPAASLPVAPAPRASRTGSGRRSSSGSSTRNREYIRNAARLALEAAEALDHAHAHGILHRDIKPANLLLDAEGRLWVTDFGLAQVRGDDRLTLSGDVVGTLRYMSPEQALGRRVVIDGRTDVYSLGVTLYELLTLRPAVDGRDRAEVLRRIAEGEPPRPRRLNPGVPVDLETIVLKATDKDPSARCATAGELAEDLRRFLEGRPVQARRPSWFDRAAKWSWRYRAVVMTAAPLLVLGTAVSTWQAVRARQAEARARSESDQARAMNDFLIADLLTQAEPAKNAPEDHVTLLEVLDRAAERVGERFRSQPEVEESLRAAMARTYHGLASWEKAERQCRAVLASARRRLGPDSAESYKAQAALAHILMHRGQVTEEVLAMARSAAEGLGRRLGPDHPETLARRTNLAAAYRAADRIAEAIALLEPTLRAQEARLGPDHTDTLTSRGGLAGAYQRAGRTAEAIALFEATLRGREARQGPDHPETLTCRTNLADAYRAAGRTAEAIALQEAVLKADESRLGPDHPYTLISRGALAGAYRAAGRTAEAIALYEAMLKADESRLGPDHPRTLTSRGGLAGAYFAAGRTAEAIALFEATLRGRESQLGPDHPHTLLTRANLAAAYWQSGRLDRSIPLFETTLRVEESKLGPDHPDALQTRANLGVNYSDSGRTDEGIRLLEDALRRGEALPGGPPAWLDWVRQALAFAYDRAHRPDRSGPLFRDGLDRARRRFGPDDPRTAAAAAALGLHLLRQERWSEAEPVLRDCLRVRAAKSPGDWATSDARSRLGAALTGQGRYAEAEPLVVAGYRGLKSLEARIPGTYRSVLPEAAARVVRLYDAWGRPDRAGAWRARLGLAELPADVFAGL